MRTGPREAWAEQRPHPGSWYDNSGEDGLARAVLEDWRGDSKASAGDLREDQQSQAGMPCWTSSHGAGVPCWILDPFRAGTQNTLVDKCKHEHKEQGARECRGLELVFFSKGKKQLLAQLVGRGLHCCRPSQLRGLICPPAEPAGGSCCARSRHKACRGRTGQAALDIGGHYFALGQT